MTKFLLANFLFISAIISANAQEGGCLTAVNGQYPSQTYVPECVGIPENIVTTGWSGEYSKVQLTAGINYVFSSSISTDLITIGDQNGQVVLKFDFGSVEYTTDIDRVVRFYTHKDAACTDDQEDRSRIVQCGDTQSEPDYGCNQNYEAGTVAYSSSIEPNFGTTANDFFVPKESGTYNLNTVSVLLYAMAGSNTDFTTFDVKILIDDNGKPGTEIYSKTEIQPLLVDEPGDLYMGYRLFWVTLDLGSVSLAVNSAEDTRYWMVFHSHSLNNMDMFWVLYPYTEGWNTQPTYSQNTNQSWEKVTHFGNGDHYDGFMKINASCDQMAVSDLNNLKFNFYPNPVQQTLNIQTNKNIENVSIRNLAGQEVFRPSKLIDGKINMKHLKKGVYIVKITLEGGQIETLRVLKR